jgi:pilus assembly protein CpaD
MTFPLPNSHTTRCVLLVVGLAAALAGCKTADKGSVTGSIYPSDVRDRHPIVLTSAPKSIDLFPRGATALDARQTADIRDFADEYLASGQGKVRILVPRGHGHEAAAQRTAAAARSQLAGSGVPGGAISQGAYHVEDPSIAAPVRVVFSAFKADVAGPCGLWPQDLGSGQSTQGWRNEPFWNLGCATRANMAAQIADPVDLVRARPEGRIDTLKRQGNIEKLRQGKDPSTQYNSSPTQINQAVGAN